MSNQVKAITKKSENVSDWYQDVIYASNLAEHGPAKGTMIIKPYGYAIWERMQRALDDKIKAMDVENCYFPLFIPMSFLSKEKDHVEGFSPELAVVTHGGGEELVEPLVVRPTSETIMYDAFSRWISSHRDLPLKVNQWNNVVRWEKRPYLFMRTTEFLWQEGHTAHKDEEEAKQMVKDALDAYISIYQDYLAIYGYAGRKSESEKFAGAKETSTYEMLMPDGKALQACTSHNLGQNFAKVFDVQYQDTDSTRKYVWQTSWGFSTRSMGGLILVHGDDNGLVLPPMIAPTQVIIIPITSKSADSSEINQITDKALTILKQHSVRVKVDETESSAGWKFNQADLVGIPLRVEIGSTEAKNSQVRLVRRDTKEGDYIDINKLGDTVEKWLKEIQLDLLAKSKKFTEDNTREAKTLDEFKEIMNTTKGFIEAFWCEDAECEKKIKEETKASTRCLPFNSIEAKGECVYCQKSAKYRWIFAQSY